MCAIFVFQPKQLNLAPRFSRLTVQGSCSFDIIGWLIVTFFQIWSLVAGYDELCVLLANQNRGNILNE